MNSHCPLRRKSERWKQHPRDQPPPPRRQPTLHHRLRRRRKPLPNRHQPGRRRQLRKQRLRHRRRHRRQLLLPHVQLPEKEAPLVQAARLQVQPPENEALASWLHLPWTSLDPCPLRRTRGTLSRWSSTHHHFSVACRRPSRQPRSCMTHRHASRRHRRWEPSSGQPPPLALLGTRLGD